MIYALVNENNIITNKIEAEPDFAATIKAKYLGDKSGLEIGDEYIEQPYPPEFSSSEMRAKARAEMRYKENDYPLILWESEAMTLDEASLRYSQYLARESTKAEALKPLIVTADEYIVNLYPDEKAEMEVADGN